MANTTHHAGLGPMASVSGHGVLAAIQTSFSSIVSWFEVRRQRRELIELDDRLLADIGLDRTGAMDEYNKSTWI